MQVGTRWVSPRESGASEAVPLTIFDRQVAGLQVRKLFVYPQGLPVARMLEVLPDALTAYPLLAGRMVRGPRGRQFDPTPRGVRVTIADHGGATPRRLAPADVDRLTAAPGRPLMAVQIGRFADGGVVLGLANDHAAMDGPSCYQLLTHWAALARGDAEPPPPCHRRAALERLCEATPAVDPASLGLRRAGVRELVGLAANVVAARALLQRVLLVADGTAMAALKARAHAERPAGSSAAISSNDALGAHLWQLLDGLEHAPLARPLALITNARGTVGELGGPRYFGNFNDLAIIPASATLGARAAGLRTIGAGWSGARTLARGRILQESERGGPRLFPGGVLDTVRGAMLLNNWSRFPIFELDFGAGKPRWFDVPRVPLRRMAIVTAHPDDPAGRLIYLSLSRADRRSLLDAPRRLHPLRLA